ncbi:uncharacterized protein LOC5574653 [Aedes aegypti]|nr:uncharacterized protein LOC5574653 [Aedes aegypti]XP_021694697.1 uncharacterized protein LOC5574653 [Aedes aegypti]
MLTATFELEQEDVSPNNILEPQQQQKQLKEKSDLTTSVKQQQQQREESNRVTTNHGADSERRRTAENRKSLFLSPLGCGWGFNRQRQQQPEQRSPPVRQFPLIKLKRRYKDKENSVRSQKEEPLESSSKSEREEVPTKKRSLLEQVEADIQRRLKASISEEKSRKRKFGCLSLVAIGQSESKKKKKQEVESVVQVEKPVVEEEPQEVISQGSSGSLSVKSRLSSSQQQIDWDQAEEISIDSSTEDGPEEPVKSVFDFDSLFEDTKVKPPPIRTYSGCSSSRLSLSKNFLQQQQQQQQQVLNVPQTAIVAQEEASRTDKLAGGGGGEDDMSIHHQQRFNLLSLYNSVSSTSSSVNYQQDFVPASSYLLLAEESQTMSAHPHYTRSKVNSMQSSRLTLNSATDMAITASMNELPRSKVSSLQGRVDTGTATELAIAQSLSEDQQNLLNSVAAPATPASIAAAANMNNSLATLCNIGNSCYLNSVLYTLRFAPNFIHNLHHLIVDTDSVYQRLNQNKLKSSSLGRNIPGLHNPSGRSWSSKDLASLGSSTTTTNSSSSTGSGTTTVGVNGTGSGGGGVSGITLLSREENFPPKSNRQVVTEQLHELFQNLHRNEDIETLEPFHAGNILRAVQDVSSTFEGNQQQDAHEFLMCVLDSIRESCQALIRTITDHPDVLISACPAVPECIETLEPQPKSSTPWSFRWRKDSVKTSKSTSNGGGGSSGATTLPKAAGSVGGTGGGGGDASDSLTSLFGKTSSVADERLVRDRLQALGLDFFRDDFEGVTVAKTKCLACETCTEQKETMIDIAIPIASNEVSDAAKNPQLFYQNSCITREYFRGDNKYRCEECCGYREAIRSISFEVLPRQLILQLKRFNGDMEKINSYIPTPFVLRCFCDTCLPKQDCDKPHIYRLYSVITHVGARMSVGHYIAYTSSLDVHAEYLGCGKDRRKQLFLSGGSLDGLAGSGVSGGSVGSIASAKSNSEKGLKKFFGGKKASSAGDMSKKSKTIAVNKMINGIESLNLINGSSTGSNNSASFGGSHSGSNSPNSNGTPTGALASRIPCAGLNCCGIHPKNSHLSLYGSGSSNGSSFNSSSLDATANGAQFLLDGGGGVNASVESHMNYINSMANGLSTGSGAGPGSPTTLAAFEQSLSQQLWHMCDDDKIKIMSQAEFEELLSPNRRHVITPYLLFYARYDLAPQKEMDATGLKGGSGDGGGGGPTCSVMID